MRRDICFLAAVLNLVSFTTGSLDFESILGSEIYGSLHAEGEIRHTFLRSETFRFFPDLVIKDTVGEELLETDPTIGVELLQLDRYDLPSLSVEDLHLKIGNTLRSLSTLSGIEYFSASRNRMRTYLYEAYRIDTPANRKPLADPVMRTLPREEHIYAFLKDSSLGSYIANVNYTYREDYFVMAINNVTTLRRFLIPIARPGKMRTYILLIPRDNEILFYGLAFVKSFDPFGTAQDREESFYNRLIALSKWFKTQLEQD